MADESPKTPIFRPFAGFSLDWLQQGLVASLEAPCGDATCATRTRSGVRPGIDLGFQLLPFDLGFASLGFQLQGDAARFSSFNSVIPNTSITTDFSQWYWRAQLGLALQGRRVGGALSADIQRSTFLDGAQVLTLDEYGFPRPSPSELTTGTGPAVSGELNFQPLPWLQIFAHGTASPQTVQDTDGNGLDTRFIEGRAGLRFIRGKRSEPAPEPAPVALRPVASSALGKLVDDGSSDGDLECLPEAPGEAFDTGDIDTGETGDTAIAEVDLSKFSIPRTEVTAARVLDSGKYSVTLGFEGIENLQPGEIDVSGSKDNLPTVESARWSRTEIAGTIVLIFDKPPEGNYEIYVERDDEKSNHISVIISSPDTDEDGINDARDKCVLRPETENRIDDEDGCPDVAPVKPAPVPVPVPVVAAPAAVSAHGFAITYPIQLPEPNTTSRTTQMVKIGSSETLIDFVLPASNLSLPTQQKEHTVQTGQKDTDGSEAQMKLTTTQKIAQAIDPSMHEIEVNCTVGAKWSEDGQQIIIKTTLPESAVPNGAWLQFSINGANGDYAYRINFEKMTEEEERSGNSSGHFDHNTDVKLRPNRPSLNSP